MTEIELKDAGDTILVDLGEAPVEYQAMDVLDRLMNEKPKEDDRRSRRREGEVPKHLLLAGTSLVDLEIPGEAERPLRRNAIAVRHPCAARRSFRTYGYCVS